MTKREEILIALHAALGTGPYTVLRNAPLGDADGYFAMLSDGETELLEEYINPPIFEFMLTPTLTVLVSSADPETGDAGDANARDTALDTAISAFESAFDQIETMPDQVIDWRMSPPKFGTHDILGAAGIKACEIGFEIEYWTDKSYG